MTEKSNNQIFVFCHGGAGYFQNSKKVKRSLVSILENSCIFPFTLESCVKNCLKSLELSGDFNCGIGSNFTQLGTIEGEAVILSSARETNSSLIKTPHATVSGIPNCILPSQLAFYLFNQPIKDSKGFYTPKSLSGSQSLSYFSPLFSSSLSSSSNTNQNYFCSDVSNLPQYAQYVRLIKEFDPHAPAKSKIRYSNKSVTDTVGSIAIDLKSGKFLVGSSSGGPWLKIPGRMSISSQPGGAVWCCNYCVGRHPGIGVCFSGTGESLAPYTPALSFGTYLLKKCTLKTCKSELETIVRIWFQENFGLVDDDTIDNFAVNSQTTSKLKSQGFNETKLKFNFYFGCLLIIRQQNCVYLVSVQNTPHFIYGFYSTNTLDKPSVYFCENQQQKCIEICIRQVFNF